MGVLWLPYQGFSLNFPASIFLCFHKGYLFISHCSSGPLQTSLNWGSFRSCALIRWRYSAATSVVDIKFSWLDVFDGLGGLCRFCGLAVSIFCSLDYFLESSNFSNVFGLTASFFSWLGIGNIIKLTFDVPKVKAEVSHSIRPTHLCSRYFWLLLEVF